MTSRDSARQPVPIKKRTGSTEGKGGMGSGRGKRQRETGRLSPASRDDSSPPSARGDRPITHRGHRPAVVFAALLFPFRRLIGSGRICPMNPGFPQFTCPALDAHYPLHPSRTEGAHTSGGSPSGTLYAILMLRTAYKFRPARSGQGGARPPSSGVVDL